MVVAGLRRMRIKRFVEGGKVLWAEVEYPEETIENQRESEALFRRLRAGIKELAKVSVEIPDEVGDLVDRVPEPTLLVDFVASNLGEDVVVKQDILADFELGSRLRRAMLLVEKQLDIARLGAKLHKQAIRMAESEENQRFFHYRPVHIPQNLRHIFQ